jgi:hypothetical protein
MIMAKDQLLALASDVDRLLAAGASSAACNDNLRKRGKTMHELGTKVAALKPVAEAIDKVLDAPALQQSGNSFLDLVSVTRQIRASLTVAGVEGPLELLPASGPWQTSLPLRDLNPLVEALTGPGVGREAKLREGMEHMAQGDLRLLSPMIDALGDGSAAVADMIANEILPSLGKAVAPELLGKMAWDGARPADLRRLRIICKSDPASGAEVCRRAIKESNQSLRAEALALFPDVDTGGEAEKAGLEWCESTNEAVRGGAILALRNAVSDEALDRVVAAIADPCRSVVAAATTTLGRMTHALTTPRLLNLVRALLRELEATRPKKTQRLDERLFHHNAPVPSSKKTVPQETVAQQRERLVSEICRWLMILSERQDEYRVETAQFALVLMEHPEEDLRDAALRTLGDLGVIVEGVVPNLARALRKTWADSAGFAASALGRMEPAQREPAIATVLELLEKGEVYLSSVREQLLDLLPLHMARFGPRILAVLRATLKDDKDCWRHRACAILAQVGPPARPLLPELLEALDAANYYSSNNNFAQTFLRIDPQGTVVIPELIDRLYDEDHLLRLEALRCLAAYGPTARVAIPEINDLLAEEEEETVRNWAEYALDSIQGTV